MISPFHSFKAALLPETALSFSCLRPCGPAMRSQSRKVHRKGARRQLLAFVLPDDVYPFPFQTCSWIADVAPSRQCRCNSLRDGSFLIISRNNPPSESFAQDPTGKELAGERNPSSPVEVFEETQSLGGAKQKAESPATLHVPPRGIL